MCAMQLVQKLAEAKDENGLLSQALQDLQVWYTSLNALYLQQHEHAPQLCNAVSALQSCLRS